MFAGEWVGGCVTNNPSNDGLVLNCPPPCRTVVSALLLRRLEDIEQSVPLVVECVLGLHAGFQLKEDELDCLRHVH